MQRCRCAALVVAAVLGCAGGAPGQKGPAGTSVGSTASAEAESDEGDPPDETSTSDEDGSADGSSSGAATTTAEASSSEGAGESSSGGAEESGGPASCVQLDTCPNATVIGTVSGDEPSDPIQIMGAEPTWVTFQVTEDNDEIGGENLQFRATLDSPAGTDFDLYVYRGATNGTTGCNGAPDDSTSTGPQDFVQMSWGEGGVANGGDDRAWIAVEIVAKDDCDGLASWTLTIEGD